MVMGSVKYSLDQMMNKPAGFDVGSGPVWCMSSLSDARKSPFKKLTANDERFALAA
jgi:hypothetical protein